MVVLGQYGPKANMQPIFPIHNRWLSEKLPAFTSFFWLRPYRLQFTVREIHLKVSVGDMTISTVYLVIYELTDNFIAHICTYNILISLIHGGNTGLQYQHFPTKKILAFHARITQDNVIDNLNCFAWSNIHIQR